MAMAMLAMTSKHGATIRKENRAFRSSRGAEIEHRLEEGEDSEARRSRGAQCDVANDLQDAENKVWAHGAEISSCADRYRSPHSRPAGTAPPASKAHLHLEEGHFRRFRARLALWRRGGRATGRPRELARYKLPLDLGDVLRSCRRATILAAAVAAFRGRRSIIPVGGPFDHFEIVFDHGTTVLPCSTNSCSTFEAASSSRRGKVAAPWSARPGC